VSQAFEHHSPADSPADGDQVSKDLRRQLESVKARMRSLREGIEATGNTPAPDESPDAA
jgi:hypothetical protein